MRQNQCQSTGVKKCLFDHRDVLFDSTLDFGIPPVLVFQLEVYCNVDKLLTGLAAQQKSHGIQINHLYLSFETKLHIELDNIFNENLHSRTILMNIGLLIRIFLFI